jgi:hypothetical protein
MSATGAVSSDCAFCKKRMNQWGFISSYWGTATPKQWKVCAACQRIVESIVGLLCQVYIPGEPTVSVVSDQATEDEIHAAQAFF